MKKISKILLFMLIMITLVFTFSVKVNAVVDKDGYEEVEGTTASPSPKTTPSAKTTSSPKSTPSPKSDTATTPHPQAGTFQTVICGAIVVIMVGGIVLAYKKIKKYNY